MSLDEVMDLTIETSSKKKKKQFNESASTYVITQEDISRSGVTSLPEALRLAPGVHVARISANQWAISIHGFNERFSNKLLVLIDGRSVYSPLFSGVYWDAQDILLENVKRIEVVRGSGTALWGSNAVNGVINVITYSAKETQGVQATAGYGTEEKGFGSLRYGGALGEKTHYRVHGKHYNRDSGGTFNQQPANDDSSMSSGGIHIDSNLTENQSLMITGNAYDGKMGQAGDVPELNSPTFTRFINDNVRLNGENLLARWTNQEGDRKNWALQAYYDHTTREDSVLGNQEVNVTDLDFQRHFGWLYNQEIAWGLQYRYVNNKLSPGTLVSLNPMQRDTHLYSAFFSDEVSLFQDQFKINIASRFEHNDFTGFEIQPTARTTWLINERNTFWGAISRSVKVPSISDQNAMFSPSIRAPSVSTGGIPIVINIAGDKNFNTEKLISYELGYRTQLNRNIQLDIATFFNEYDDLRTFEKKDIFFLQNPFRGVVPFEFGNNMRGHVYGSDLSAKWQVNSWWCINAGYSYAKTVLHLKNASTDTLSLILPVFANSPEQMFSLRSAWDVQRNWKIDLWMRYVDKLESTYVNAYVNMDARVAWKASRNIELSVVGQNLLDKQQLQFFKDTATRLYNSEVERSVYFKIKLDI
ncbi:MAG TPA: TonB-dependent receptor [Methylobacter sp.]|jgi:iron complex outermembrane receptor protein